MGEWIEIYGKSTLPQTDGEYLCSCVSLEPRLQGTKRVMSLGFLDRKWTDCDDYYDINEYWKVVAWMPLPAPFTSIPEAAAWKATQTPPTTRGRG